VFQPVRPVLSVHQNNRDHRKLCVIDGIVGFTGGINLADEYINQIERFGYWKDSALLMRGEAVWSLTVMFLHMWESIRHARIDYSRFRPESFPPVANSVGFVQPYFDTPLATDTICADLHLQMFSKAKQYLYITTPYLVIDDTIASALHISAYSGVDVRIMTPHIPDKKMVFSVTQSHYESLLRAGVRIYEFLPGFIHSKTVVADDLYASVGSCNLDYRSFYLQLENGTWLCGTPSVLAIRDDFISSLSFCKEITLDDCQTISLPKRIIRSVLRIFSPLL
jgi:cardiolipin synthase